MPRRWQRARRKNRRRELLTAITAKPRRISARLSMTLEDVAAIGQANFESALRQNLSAGLSDEYDKQCINGDGEAPNVEGLIAQLADPDDPAALATFDSFLDSFAGAIDGLWASMLSEVAIVSNVDAYKLGFQVVPRFNGRERLPRLHLVFGLRARESGRLVDIETDASNRRQDRAGDRLQNGASGPENCVPSYVGGALR